MGPVECRRPDEDRKLIQRGSHIMKSLTCGLGHKDNEASSSETLSVDHDNTMLRINRSLAFEILRPHIKDERDGDWVWATCRPRQQTSPKGIRALFPDAERSLGGRDG